MGEHTVICGLERISLRVARALIELGEGVTILAESPEPALLREARRAGARIIEGRTSELAHLHQLELESARCIVLTEDADLSNMQAALAAREVNPAIWVVLRMFNADLADRATRLLANSRAVSTSAEAAPYFAAAALGLDSAPTRLVWGRHVVLDPAVGASPPDPDGGGGGLAAAAARLRAALGLGDARSPTQPPVELWDGEFLHPFEPASPSRRRRSRRLRTYRRAFLALFDPRLPVLAAALTALLGASVAVFHAARGLYPGSAQPTAGSWIDALVFTVTTAYGNTNLAGADWGIKLYAVGFMFAIALAIALTFGLVADIAIGASIMEALGVPRGHMRNHVVVLGLGNVGYRTVLHLLDAGVEVAAASRSAGRFVAAARRQGVPVLLAAAHFPDSLRALSVERARAVVAATDDDLANLEAALAARELNPNARVVTRLWDQDLADRAQQQLHITACQSVSALASPAFVAAALGEGVLSTIERGGRLSLLAEARVQAGSDADGLSLETLEAPRDVRVLAVRTGTRERWRPACPERLAAGHEVLVACSPEAWDRVRRQVRTAEPAPA